MDRVHRLAFEGAKLDELAARQLEAALSENPADRDARYRHLGFLDWPRVQSVEAQRWWLTHMLWFLENDIADPVLNSPWAKTYFESDEIVAEYVAAWDRQLALPSCTAHTVLVAARASPHSRPERARRLLEKGEEMEPTWSRWAVELGGHLLRAVVAARDSARLQRHLPAESARYRPDPHALPPELWTSVAASALAHLERALRIEDYVGFRRLADCAGAAALAEIDHRALSYASRALAAQRPANDRHYFDELHKVHMILGALALRQSDRDGAKRELLAAVRWGPEDAPVLRSFGPEFELAHSLLLLGERDVVSEYLKQCQQFWNPRRIGRWLERIGRGETPFLTRRYLSTERGLDDGAVTKSNG